MSKKTESKQKRGFGKRVVSTLDWTFLPISELRHLKRSTGIALSMLKDLVSFSWAVIRVNSKDMISSDFYKRIIRKTGAVEFAENLSAEQKEILHNHLTRSFLRKRLASISFVFIVFLIGAIFFAMSIFSPSPSLFRMVVLLLMLLGVGAYLWVSMTHYENLRYYYNNYCELKLNPAMRLDDTTNHNKTLELKKDE